MTSFSFRPAIATVVAATLAAPISAAPPGPRAPVGPSPIEIVAKPPPASTKTVPRIFLSADGQTVYVVGAILEEAFLRFDALLQKAPQAKRVYLDSPGGLTLEGRLIAALVRKRHLDTYVEHYCASACTQVFVSGRERVLGPQAELGFHQAVAVDVRGETSSLAEASSRRLNPLTVFGINGNDTLRLAYEQAGIDPVFIGKALARKHEDIWLPTTEEMLADKVISRRAAASEIAARQGDHTRAEIEALVASRPLWHAAQSALPQGYAGGVSDAWRRANTGSSLDTAIASGRGALVLAAWPVLAAAGDPLLDRMLTLYASSARLQGTQGYPMCKETIEDDNAPISQLYASFEAGEDALLLDLFGQTARGKPMRLDEARKVFERDVAPVMLETYYATDTKSSSANCRLGFKIFEAIDALPARKRINAYRALLTLPGSKDE